MPRTKCKTNTACVAFVVTGERSPTWGRGRPTYLVGPDVAANSNASAAASRSAVRTSRCTSPLPSVVSACQGDFTLPASETRITLCHSPFAPFERVQKGVAAHLQRPMGED